MEMQSSVQQGKKRTVEPTISVLNGLIGVCRDTYNGYLEAAEGVASTRYKTMFAEYAHQRDRFSADLANFILEMGGAVTGTSDKVDTTHHVWANIRAATTNGETGVILAECERGEDAAMEAYERALHNTLPQKIYQVVKNQYDLVVRAHNRIRDLRDTYRQ